MHCPSCGAVQAAQANFCPMCGAVATTAITPKWTVKGVLRQAALWIAGAVVVLLTVELLLGLRLPPMALLGLAVWAGIFAAIKASTRRLIWFVGGFVLGLATANVAAYFGMLYRATLS